MPKCWDVLRASLLLLPLCAAAPAIEVPTAGNSWVEDDLDATDELVTERGVQGWPCGGGKIITYVRLPGKGVLELALNARAAGGLSKVEVTVGETTRSARLPGPGQGLGRVAAGSFPIGRAGYVRISMRCEGAGPGARLDVPSLFLGGSATEGGPVEFAKNDFEWERRGPYALLSYPLPTEEPVEWFYSEVTVPEGQDVVGSYFEANGFDEGYFGMQVNSPTERHVLFSVWSSYETDEPSEIPTKERVRPLRKGEGVTVGEFGGEGSGGQSYLVYPWKAGRTYRFLVRGAPVGKEAAAYAAYFYAPELGRWRLIASFRRPGGTPGLAGLYSFLENFEPSGGQFGRKALYGRQWVKPWRGGWRELTRAEFEVQPDNGGRSRRDYQAGVEAGQFFLRICGFFDGGAPANGTSLERPASGAPPDVDLERLP